MLGPPADRGRDPLLAQEALHLGDELLDVGVPLGGPGAQQLLDLGVARRVEDGEAAVLQLVLDALHPQTMGQGGVDLQGLGGDTGLLLGGQGVQGADVVEAVGQLDQEHPHVASHGDDHLADRGSLRLLEVREPDPVEHGHAVDEVGHGVAEAGPHLVERQVGVLQGVVEQSRRHRPGIEAVPGEDAGHGQRVGDVGVAGAAQLPRMRSRRGDVGADQQIGISGWEVAAELGEHRLQVGREVAYLSGVGIGHGRSPAPARHWAPSGREVHVAPIG